MGNVERRSSAYEAGRRLRKRLPRRELAKLVLPADRDPFAILEEQHASRLKDLVPVRVGRMLQSPFAFYRGTAAVMAADLRSAPTTDLEVVSCGDAHISNFGFFASPERALVFDLNDFDEGGVAPWEWDVRRLTASVHVGGRDIGLSEDACRAAAFAAADAYRSTLRDYCRLSTRERYYTRVDMSSVARHFGEEGEQTVRKAAKKARARTSERLLQRLTTISIDGGIRIVDQPPVLRHVDHATLGEVTDLFTQYRATLREDIAFLLEQYRVVDFALRVVGVGSVGTRCYLIAVEGPTGDILFLQAKEAPPSVLSTYGGRRSLIPGRPSLTDFIEGHRVVAAQRILQANSDLFVGWMRGWAGDAADRYRVDYYWRQFRDMKGRSTRPRSTPINSAHTARCARHSWLGRTGSRPPRPRSWATSADQTSSPRRRRHGRPPTPMSPRPTSSCCVKRLHPDASRPRPASEPGGPERSASPTEPSDYTIPGLRWNPPPRTAPSKEIDMAKIDMAKTNNAKLDTTKVKEVLAQGVKVVAEVKAVSAGAKVGLAVVGVLQVVFAFLAFWDLARRDADEVVGPKPVWIPVILVNWIGPAAYYLFGIRHQR